MKEHNFIDSLSLQALLVIFANAKPCKNAIGFVVESSYKDSKYSNYSLTNEIAKKNNDLLYEFTGLKFKFKLSESQITHQYFIGSTLSTDDFFSFIYKHIQIKRVQDNISDRKFSDLIILSFFALRGSPDFNRNFYSVDLLKKILTEKYVDYLFKLLSNVTDLRQLNLNFRELQEQFVSGINQRNSQFRINLRYFYENLLCNIKDINIFKADILIKNKDRILSRGISQESRTFVDRFFFYKSKVLNKKNTIEEIEKLRKELGFIYDKSIDNEIKRNQGIVQYVRIFFDDECACCKNKYNIEDRSFKYRNLERWYLEIHHVISFSADRALDQIDNLVKICPTCHRALTKNRASEEYQKELINEIFVNEPRVKEFCLNFTDEDTCVQFVYDRLR